MHRNHAKRETRKRAIRDKRLNKFSVKFLMIYFLYIINIILKLNTLAALVATNNCHYNITAFY